MIQHTRAQPRKQNTPPLRPHLTDTKGRISPTKGAERARWNKFDLHHSHNHKLATQHSHAQGQSPALHYEAGFEAVAAGCDPDPEPAPLSTAEVVGSSAVSLVPKAAPAGGVAFAGSPAGSATASAVAASSLAWFGSARGRGAACVGCRAVSGLGVGCGAALGPGWPVLAATPSLAVPEPASVSVSPRPGEALGGPFAAAPLASALPAPLGGTVGGWGCGSRMSSTTSAGFTASLGRQKSTNTCEAWISDSVASLFMNSESWPRRCSTKSRCMLPNHCHSTTTMNGRHNAFLHSCTKHTRHHIPSWEEEAVAP